MIQVLGRAFGIIEHIGQCGSSPLRDIALAADLPKNTTANILKTLKDLGYLAKNDAGRYSLGNRCARLVSAYHGAAAMPLLRDAMTGLSGTLRESVVAAVLENGDRRVIAEAQCIREVTVNMNMSRTESAYAFTTGRVFLAYMSAPALREFIERQGLPKAEEWRNAVTRSGLHAALASIRRKGISIIHQGETMGFASPVFGADRTVACALGVYLPTSRYTKDVRSTIPRELKAAAESLSAQYINAGITAFLTPHKKPI
ncbi:MAG: IclR family transcriptional regulator [Spirochaetota bacterium]